MAEQRITTKPTVDALLENDYIFIDHEGSLRRVRKSDAGLASSADLQEFEESETAAREQFEENIVEANEEFAESVTEQIANKADIDGNYEGLTSGTSEQLLSTQSTEDQVPYLFRKSGGGKSIGNREIDTVAGGSVAWNQLFSYIGGGTFNGVTLTMSDGKITVNGTATSTVYRPNAAPHRSIANHVYFVSQGKANAGISFYNDGKGVSTNSQANNIGKATGEGTFYFRVAGGASFDNDEFIPQIIDLTSAFNPAVADRLYQMEQANAGSGVALFRSWFSKKYYAYNQGEIKSVKTSAHEMVDFNQWDEEWESGGLDDNGAPIYSANNIRSKNYIPVLPNTSYCFRIEQSAYIRYFDEDKVFIGKMDKNGFGNVTNNPSDPIAIRTTHNNCRYIKFYTPGTTYNHDICISISSDRNGEYEPYQNRTYALDDIELRGVPKLIDNEIQYDGDTYDADGKVTRRYGIVDLGTLNWLYRNQRFDATLTLGAKIGLASGGVNAVCVKYPKDTHNYAGMADKSFICGSGYVDGRTCSVIVYDSAYTDLATFKSAMTGVYLVYELATPTTETASPYASPQIVDPNGTERYVDEREVAVPVGHKTEYPEDLVAKLDGLPWDFSSLIAPTEKAYTATRNYTVGSYLIMDNTLYKVTAAIASGGTITVGTNVAATTIMAEIIAAL